MQGAGNRLMRSRLLGAALAVAVATGTLAPRASAQFIVNDPVHTMQNIFTQLRNIAAQAAEYQQQYTRWVQTYSHYQQQLVRMAGIIKSFGLPTARPLEKVDPDYLVAERCGGSFNPIGILRALSPVKTGDYVAQQRENCAQIQRIRNLKYNETVQFIKETVPAMEADMKRIEAMRSQNNDNGTVDASAEASMQLMANLETQMQAWNVRMQSYDGLVAMLEQSQKQLAQMALKGDRNPIGTVVKTGALKAALKVGK